MSRMVLETHLTPDECFNRIAQHTHPWPLLFVGGDWSARWGTPLSSLDVGYLDPLLARVDPPRIHLAYLLGARTLLRGGIFRGRIVRESGRTRVYGRVGVSALGMFLFTVCFALPFSLLLVVPTLFSWLSKLQPAFAVVVLVVLVFALWKVIRAAWDHGGSEDPYSVRLREILQADSNAARGRGQPPI